jgi:hypothetical protein
MISSSAWDIHSFCFFTRVSVHFSRIIKTWLLEELRDRAGIVSEIEQIHPTGSVLGYSRQYRVIVN